MLSLYFPSLFPLLSALVIPVMLILNLLVNSDYFLFLTLLAVARCLMEVYLDHSILNNDLTLKTPVELICMYWAVKRIPPSRLLINHHS